MRRDDVARLAGVDLDSVEQVTRDAVRQALADRVREVVLYVALPEPGVYWRVGSRYFLDDPAFGEVVDFADLDYNGDLGLFVRNRE